MDKMKKNKFLAWLLIVAVFITTFSTSVIPAQADRANAASSVVQTEVELAQVELSDALANQASDTEKPTIIIEGIQDKQEVSDKAISFSVVVTDNVYKDIVPEVKLNGVALPATSGEYQATLNLGSNVITVTAVDGAGNQADLIYQITYNITAAEQLNNSLAYIVNTVKAPTFFGEWSMLALARANYDVPANASPAPTVTPQDPSQNTNDIKQLYTDADKISPWAYSAIETATVQGYIQGNNGQVNPKANITRAEFTKLLVSVLELDITSDKGITYKDVALGDWFYPYVNAAHKAGLITGFNNEFKPNDKITREQMATIIVRALALPATKPATAIKELSSVSAWAKADVETIVATGLMLGDNNQFKPKELVTREMAAVVATRAHDYKSGNKAVTPYIQNTAAFLQKTVTSPGISSVGGDWTVFGLARSGVKVPDSYYAKYYANVEATLKEKSGKLHSVKYTEYDRVILALTSIGKSVDQVAGYNLLEPLADFDTVIKQGINGPVFALIALDSNQYEIPVVKDVKTQTTRELLIDYILGREISDGGWALGSNATVADPDITGMIIQSLTPYYKTNAKVTTAVDRGIAWLSKNQSADGGFASWESTNSESIAQVIVALTGLGIDPHKDFRFIKNGHSAVDALLGFTTPEGGFYHVKQGGVSNGGAQPGEVDLMATDQAMYALIAYDRYVNGQTRIYDLTDVK